jgi:hypothetical protein
MSARFQGTGRSRAGWGKHEQRHCTAACESYMESRLLFLTALIAAAQGELQRVFEEVSNPVSTFELYVQASEEPSPDIDATLSRMTPSIIVAHTSRQSFSTPRKRLPIGELIV